MKHSSTYLCQMVEQIVANQPRDFDEATNAQRVASHLQRFWAPSMRSDFLAIEAERLSPMLRAVQARIEAPSSSGETA